MLADVGSAGVSHKVWQPIAPQSVLVGFDPDTRNRDTAFGRDYRRAVLVELRGVAGQNRRDAAGRRSR